MKTLEPNKHYVVGFLFDLRLTRVVLIKKNRPDFQVGKLNGVGGKIESGETPEDAMSREFEEECGIHFPESAWTKFHSETFARSGHTAHFLYAVSEQLFRVRTMTDESVDVYIIDNFPGLPVMYNLTYLVEMAKVHFMNPEHRWVVS